MAKLHLSSFGGGVALLGSADIQKTDELQVCDSYDIGERGQLVVASDLSNYGVLSIPAGGNASNLYGITEAGTAQDRYLLIVAECVIPAVGNRMNVFKFQIPSNVKASLASGPARAQGAIVTFAAFPFVDRLGVQQRPTLICIACRETEDPRTGNGLYVHHESGIFSEDTGDVFDWLGTGSGQYNEPTAGTLAVPLFPRGIAAYNNHIFYWGFHNLDAVKGDAPNRLGFSNLGNPFKIGNDPGILVGNRLFDDTDAINIGGSGEIIRAGYPWAGKFWIGTNKELHYLAGFGRESFLTNGTVGIRKSRNVCGPHSMIEGPDALLYGVSTEGLWAFDGATVEPIYRALVDFRGKSLGWWDLIWTDDTRAVGYPGKTNQDLVWMLADPEAMQVWVGIPFCNAAAGYGFGADTVIIKFHTQTGGFTRQVFIGQILTGGVLVRRESGTPTRRFIIQQLNAGNNLRVYGIKADASVSPIMPVALPNVAFGEYAPFGPDGSGVTRRMYLTISWDNAASLPIVFQATPYVDQQAFPPIRLSIQVAAPVAPANGDLWLDTSGTDPNLGNANAGVLIGAAADYVLKRWITSWNKWVGVPSEGGMKGTRATIPIAYQGAPGSRVKLELPTVAAAGRYQIEGLGLEPAGAASS